MLWKKQRNKLDRQQQVNEGWFAEVADVPPQAISATVKCIYQCKNILSVVPHAAKASAIYLTLSSTKKDPMVPASALMDHPSWIIYADADSAAKWNAVCEDGKVCTFME